MAWDANTRQYTLSAEMFNYLGVSQGALDGVIKGDVTYEYYTDLKQIASLTTVNDNYIFGNLISLTLTSGDGDSANLGYFCVKSVSKKERQGMVLKEYELVSLLYKIQTHKYSGIYTLNGTYNILGAINAGGTINQFNQISLDSSYTSTSHDFSGSNLACERGDDCLTFFNKIISTYNWVSVLDGWQIHLQPYKNPNTQESKFTFTLDNGTISGDVEYKDGRYNCYNSAGRWYDKDNVNIDYAQENWDDANVGCNVFQQILDDDQQLDTLTPATTEQLQAVTQAELAKDLIVHNEYEFDGIYAGLHAGDACTITLSDGTHKCMVKSLKLTIDKAMKCHYTLKDFTNG